MCAGREAGPRAEVDGVCVCMCMRCGEVEDDAEGWGEVKDWFVAGGGKEMLGFIDIGWRDGDQDVDYRAAAEGGHGGAADVGEVDVGDILQQGSESLDNVITLGRPICAVFLDGACHFVVVLKFVSS